MAHGNIILSGGLLFTMKDGEAPFFATVVINDGRVSDIIPGTAGSGIADCPPGATLYDAEGLYITPGFIDIHAHDECKEVDTVVEQALLRQGVTTVLSGNCGMGLLFEDSAAMHPHPWINLHCLVGNAVLRQAAGQTDRYAPATPEQRLVMCGLLAESLRRGAAGLSFGLEYEPGAALDEINDLAGVTAGFDGFISVHTRFDDDRCVDAIREAIAISRAHGIRVEISHLASMTSYHTEECMETIDAAKKEGLRVTFDCYPYDAFCAQIGSAVFDDGFAERWRGKGPECLEAVSGRFKGQRLDWDSFAEMRRETPDALIVAYVIDQDAVERCIAHPDCIPASDTYYYGDGAHPRMSGTFPRALRILRKHGYNWNDALKKITSAPAEILHIDAGRIDIGSRADITVFDPESFADKAVYREPFLPPAGMRLVVVNGEIALKDGEISPAPAGELRRRQWPA
jgi:N-acyl-D-amino-acid deacylase